MLTTTITVKVSAPGMHHWPGAPENRSYLRDLHRHLFLVEAEVVVHHDDRDVEYHDLQDHTLLAFRDLALNPTSTLLVFGSASCEQLAVDLFDALRRCDLDVARVSVSEDGENTATVRSTP